ncbi:MAG: PIN domain-containing protein [Terriglobales bacterium]
MTALKTNECRIVVDAQVFVPAMAHSEEESRIYALLLRKCCKVVVSTHITDEYQSVMTKFGYSGTPVLMELNRLATMNKLRECNHPPPDDIPEELAPRKDRHIIAPCMSGYANYIISTDRGIQERREEIHRRTGARVLDLDQAEREFGSRDNCRPDTAGER